MSTAARIDELRKKFEENPRRYFAPLANELRKAGELTQSIALCREHLPKQPGHMSGYIVFGQALYESGELDEARSVFEQALALDPENLIALHHLGHIAKQQGDTAAARRWYERALETDPRNDDIAHQLASLATPVRPQPVVPTPAAPLPSVAHGLPGAIPDAPPAIDLDADLAILDAGLLTPRRDLGAIPTPPAAQDAIGAMPIAPTPDASLRAIDFDEVNARLSASTASATPEVPHAAIESNDLMHDVMEDVRMDASDDGSSEASSEAGEPAAGVTARHEPLDLSLDEGEPAASANAQALADDPFAYVPEETTGAPPLDLDAPDTTPPEALEAAFEEGLVTAGWPDTADLGLRADTPRADTPRANTPVAVDVSPDLVEAFGRGPDDPIAVSLPEPEPDVLGAEADLLPPDAAFSLSTTLDEPPADASVSETAPLTAAAELDEHTLDEHTNERDAGDELPWIAAPATPTEDVEAIAQAMADDARALGEDSAVSLYAFTEAETFAPSDELSDDPGMNADADAAAEDETPQAPAFVTETMGELLVAQGFVDRAVSVYEELVRRRPYDPLLSARLEELRAQLDSAEPVPVYTARERYAALAARRVVRRTPARSMTPVATLTPVASRSPVYTTRVATPVATPLVSPAVQPVADDSLASLFGGDASKDDDYAAQALADAFAPLPLETDAAAAFNASFFGAADVAREPTPAYGAARQPTPMAPAPAVDPAVDEGSAEFSFDRFFPDPAANTASAAAAAATTGDDAETAASNHVESAPPALGTGDGSPGDDLAQFSAWLKGLGNS